MPEHRCDVCQKVFRFPSSLKRHIDAVHLGFKPNACGECDAAFAQAGHLKSHIDAVHLRLKPHVCGECEATFAQGSHLKSHIDAVHLGLKPHPCGECDATFSHAGDLRRHYEAVHLGLKPFACGECEKTFSLASDLKRHFYALHLWIKPHACSQCEKTFIQKQGLKIHLSVVHLGLKPHSCNECDEKFAYKSSLDTHFFYEHTEEGGRHKNDVDHARKNGYSVESMKYFDIINKRLDLFIQHARTGGEHKIRVPERGWKADGYIEDYDTVIEYMGCYFHGCPDCVPNREEIIKGKTAQKRYDETQFRLSKIREKYSNVFVVWGHEFAEMLEDEETLGDHLLDIKILLGLPIDLPPIKRQQQMTDYFGDTQTPPKDLPDEPEHKFSIEPKRRRLNPENLESA